MWFCLHYCHYFPILSNHRLSAPNIPVYGMLSGGDKSYGTSLGLLSAQWSLLVVGSLVEMKFQPTPPSYIHPNPDNTKILHYVTWCFSPHTDSNHSPPHTTVQDISWLLTSLPLWFDSLLTFQVANRTIHSSCFLFHWLSHRFCLWLILEKACGLNSMIGSQRPPV